MGALGSVMAHPQVDLSRVQSKNVGNVSSGRIPIHCVAVFGLGEKSGILPVFGERSSVIEWNDKLRSRSPPGIKHITCWDYGIEFRNCTTRWDADGSMISREICNSGDGGGYELLQHCTKHAVYYKDRIPQWDNHEPVWTHKLDSSPTDVQGGLPLEATRPFGMYVHEIRKYQAIPVPGGIFSMLVWKSYRSADKFA
ncbi:hypothetical protein RSOL_192480, partial [Rhizoctonia solani AG-3 Rhs1AP]